MIGSSARTRRRPRLAMVSGLLVAQISRRNGGMLRSAPTRSRRLGLVRGRGAGGAGVGTAQPHQNAVAMIAYTAIIAAPSIQLDSPSKVMKALMITASDTDTTSIGENTSVNVAKPRTCDA